MSERIVKLLSKLVEEGDLEENDYLFCFNLLHNNSLLTKDQELRIIKLYDGAFGYGYER